MRTTLGQHLSVTIPSQGEAHQVNFPYIAHPPPTLGLNINRYINDVPRMDPNVKGTGMLFLPPRGLADFCPTQSVQGRMLNVFTHEAFKVSFRVNNYGEIKMHCHAVYCLDQSDMRASKFLQTQMKAFDDNASIKFTTQQYFYFCACITMVSFYQGSNNTNNNEPHSV